MQAGKDAGLSRRQTVTALRVANVPAVEFEEQVESRATGVQRPRGKPVQRMNRGGPLVCSGRGPSRYRLARKRGSLTRTEAPQHSTKPNSALARSCVGMSRRSSRETTAYHEAGHAVVAYLLGVQLGPVSIIPFAQFAGVTGLAGYTREISSDALEGVLIKFKNSVKVFWPVITHKKCSNHAACVERILWTMMRQ
jgi:hypothetical protein